MQFISHAENVSKGFADRKLTDNESYCKIQELFKRITEFNKEWAEQEICLQRIK